MYRSELTYLGLTPTTNDLRGRETNLDRIKEAMKCDIVGDGNGYLCVMLLIVYNLQ